MRPLSILSMLFLVACSTQPNQPEIDSFEDCAAAGYPIMESYPEQCRTPDGRTFVRDISGDSNSSQSA
jgi:hypothetical protein